MQYFGTRRAEYAYIPMISCVTGEHHLYAHGVIEASPHDTTRHDIRLGQELSIVKCS